MLTALLYKSVGKSEFKTGLLLLTFSLANAEVFRGRWWWWGREVEMKLHLKYVRVGSEMMCGVAQLSLLRCVTTRVTAASTHIILQGSEKCSYKC